MVFDLNGCHSKSGQGRSFEIRPDFGSPLYSLSWHILVWDSYRFLILLCAFRNVVTLDGKTGYECNGNVMSWT